MSGLPLPRFVSLKSDRVNLREGPTRTTGPRGSFKRAGLPVEITAEFENWRRIRDSEGTEGWVLHSLLSGRAHGAGRAWKKEPNLLPARRAGCMTAAVTAQLQSGVHRDAQACDGTWCRLAGEGFDGWIEQENLWGVYPGEKVE